MDAWSSNWECWFWIWLKKSSWSITSIVTTSLNLVLLLISVNNCFPHFLKTLMLSLLTNKPVTMFMF
jgi:hypothetical protein